MSKRKKVTVFKIILLIMVLIICGAITLYLFPVMKNLYTPEGQANFKQKVSDTGILGLLALFGIQLAQMFLFVVPGEPIEILAGMCYGTIWGTIFIVISSLIVSTGIFYLSRKFGRKFVCLFCKEETVEKIENSKNFKNPKKIEIIMLILFLVPGTPKDLLVYIGGLLPIKPMRFLLISTFAKLPSIVSSTLAGANIAVGDWKMGIILYIGVILITILIIIILQKYDKTKATEEAMKVIKK